MTGLLCLAIPVFVLTAYHGWVYWKERRFVERLHRAGESTSGIISERTQEYAGRGGMICVIGYQFQVEAASGDTVRWAQRQQVSSKVFMRLSEGERVPIRYLAGDPSTSRLDGAYQDRSKERSQAAVFGFCVVLSILFVVALLHP